MRVEDKRLKNRIFHPINLLYTNTLLQKGGRWKIELYSFKDVVILAVSKKLLDAGVNLQNVTAAIGFLTQRSTDQLANEIGRAHV